jgi:hypothetical protein
MHQIVKTSVMALLLSSALVAAGPVEIPRTIAATLSVNPGKSVIHGIALDTNAAPLRAIQVRLRNLETRAIEQVSTTNAAGEFVFVALPDIPYVVEIADTPGRVLAVGDVILTRPGEVAGSIIVVAPSLEGYANLFRSTAGAVASAAAGTGMTLLQSSTPPLSPEK